MSKPTSPSLHALKGLGPKSSAQLQAIGISTRADLERVGAIPAYLKLQQLNKTVSLNFLYALVGALEDRHWQDVAKTQREDLQLQLEGHAALARLAAEQTRDMCNKSKG